MTQSHVNREELTTVAKLIEAPILEMKKKLLVVYHYLVANSFDPILEFNYHNVMIVLV